MDPLVRRLVSFTANKAETVVTILPLVITILGEDLTKEVGRRFLDQAMNKAADTRSILTALDEFLAKLEADLHKTHARIKND